MKLSEVMTTNPEYIQPSTTLSDAARKMRDLDVGMLPIGDGVKLKGILTDRDITVRAVAEGLDPSTATASEVMSPEVLYAFEDEGIEKAIDTMQNKQVRRLIILNRDKDMVGIVALADIATEAGEADVKAEAVKAVSAS